MNSKIERLLNNEMDNYIFPFFWQHGETESILREYMQVIYNANIRAVCIESRPHPDFVGARWWHDMDIILDEARRRKMKVWILDDSHFPTGYCNGKIEEKPDSCRRWFLTYKVLGEVAAGCEQTWEATEYKSAAPFESTWIEDYFDMSFETFSDDQWLGAVAVKKNGSGEKDLVILKENEGKIVFMPSEGDWQIYSCQLTRNRGSHRNYMNMLDKEACRTLIETVYEPHYAHYKDDFGKTIAGFFSDEPEIGNGHLYLMDQKIYEQDDQPWSIQLQKDLEKHWGADYLKFLPLLWERKFDENITAKVRYGFMDMVTRRVEEDFSMQIGDWCREHGVKYIGHLIEDNNQHARCGSSLGHFFRGLAGQDMSGIDDIGGQVLPQGEDTLYVSHLGTKRDGVFYHFALGRLASSAAAIDARKKNRSMCEIFGNYGWKEGVRLEAYLAEHFMVRGVNHYVPHAFSPKAFPDPDCPPHFYAHGHNPQYRHFGELMKYMNRICNLISGGRHESEAAILYHGDAEWSGMTCMYIQEPARVLTEAQIGFDFVPSDIFTDSCYQVSLDNGLKVHTQEYKIFIIPEADYITKETADAIVKLGEQGFPCVFVNSYPKGICSQIESGKEEVLLEEVRENAKSVKLTELADYMRERKMPQLQLSPAEKFIRSYQYYGEPEILYLVNEGTEIYEGNIRLQGTPEICYRYDAWENRLELLDVRACTELSEALEDCETESGLEIKVRIEPGKSWIIVFDQEMPGNLKERSIYHIVRKIKIESNWKRTVCKSIDYPAFGHSSQVSLPDFAERELPDFAGVLRYEQDVNLGTEVESNTILEITDAGETVQVFVNGTDCGIQIVPPYRYEIGNFLHQGENRIAIEVATTLERQISPKNKSENWQPQNHVGLCGKVYLCQKK